MGRLVAASMASRGDDGYLTCRWGGGRCAFKTLGEDVMLRHWEAHASFDGVTPATGEAELRDGLAADLEEFAAAVRAEALTEARAELLRLKRGAPGADARYAFGAAAEAVGRLRWLPRDTIQ